MPLSCRRTPALAVLGAWLAVFTSCALAPPAVDVPEGSRVTVILEEPARGLRLALANASHPDLHDVYSEERADGHLKLAPDRLMGELLHSLGRAGLGEHGRPVDALPTGSVPRLVVRLDERTTLFERPSSGDDPEASRAFARIELVMNEYYQHVGALQAVENERGGALLRSQRQPGVEVAP